MSLHVGALERERSPLSELDGSPASGGAARKSIVRQAFNPGSTWTASDEVEGEDSPSWHSLSYGTPAGQRDEIAAGREPLLGAAPSRRPLDGVVRFMQRACALAIMSVLLLIECVPFGLAFFPASWERFPVPRALGIQMFLLSSALAQAVFALSSKFEVGTGLMMCENIPFMTQIATDVRAQLAAQGREDEALPTVLAAYSLSTLLVGGSFLALGHMRLGAVIALIPPYIILGCIGGIGVFIVQTGLEISTGVPFNWQLDTLRTLCSAQTGALWLLPLGLSAALRLLSRLVRSPMLTPLFFVAIPLVAHAALRAAGRSLAEPRVRRWFFEEAPTPDWWLLWSVYRHGSIAWDVLPSQLGTFGALTAFSLIHVPINVPSLSMTTGTLADIDGELRAHGVANLLSGALGCLPNYVCYSNSALYYKCGGGGRGFSAALALVLGAAFVAGPTAIHVLPRCMAGTLLLHMGVELLREAIVQPFARLDRIEYTAVVLIAVVMTSAGMAQGLLVSGVLCLLTFVLQSSRVPVVCKVAHGASLRSSAWRNIAEIDVLAAHAQRLYLIGLQGALFFANFAQLSGAIDAAIAKSRAADAAAGAAPRGHDRRIFLVIDMSAVTTLDTAAAKALEKTCAELRELQLAHVALVLPTPPKGGCEPEHDPAYSHLFRAARACAAAADARVSASSSASARGAQPTAALPPALPAEWPMLHIAHTVDGAVAWCEEVMLGRTRARARADALGASAGGVLRGTSSANSLEAMLLAVAPSSATRGNDSPRLRDELLAWFAPRTVEEGTVLWREGERSEQALVLLDGVLEAVDEAGAAQRTDVSGCMLGEFGLITGEHRQNTLRALCGCSLYELTRERWVQMGDEAPRLAFVLACVALKYAGNRLHQVAFSALHSSSAVPV